MQNLQTDNWIIVSRSNKVAVAIKYKDECYVKYCSSSIIINCGKKTFVKIIHISIERIKRKIDKSFANLKKEQEIETYPF